MLKRYLAGWLLVVASVGSAAEFQDNSSEVFVPIAGEVLDIAIEHCRRGELVQARALFSAIQAQLDPPPSIRQLILALEQGACLAKRPGSGQWELRALVGYDDNVSQGIRASSLILGTASYRTELILDEGYRPVPSSFVEMTAGHTWNLADRFNLRVKAGGRHYQSAKNYDLSNASALLNTRVEALGRPVELMGEWTELWLGGRHYHSALAVAAQVPIVAEAPQWNFAAVAQTVKYHTQPQQNAAQFQLGIQRRLYAGPEKAVLLGVMGIWDHALGLRAGGDRSGVNLQAEGQIKVQPWLLIGRIGMTHWISRQIFSPGFIDEKRRNTMMQLGVLAEYPLAPGQTLQFDLQMRDSKDTVALYAYRSFSLGVSWSVRF